MCSYFDSTFTTAGVSSAEKVAIVNEHNNYRSAVNPSATNMHKMVSYLPLNTSIEGSNNRKNRLGSIKR